MKQVFRPTSRLVIIKDKKVLLCKMGYGWGLPGGGIDWGESIDTALEREAVEELGIPAQFDKIIFIQDFLVPFHDLQTNNHGLEYFCTIKNNSDFYDVVDTYHNSSHAHELNDLDWFTLDNIPTDMRPMSFIPVLKKYMDNPLNFSCEYISGIK